MGDAKALMADFVSSFFFFSFTCDNLHLKYLMPKKLSGFFCVKIVALELGKKKQKLQTPCIKFTFMNYSELIIDKEDSSNKSKRNRNQKAGNQNNSFTFVLYVSCSVSCFV